MKLIAIIYSCFLFIVPVFSQQVSALKLHPQNPHYFLYEDKPVVLIGSGEVYGSVINLDFDYKKYLHTLSSDGLNVTRVFMGSYIETVGDFGVEKNTLAPAEGRLLLPWKRSNTPGFTLGGNKFDLDEWDENYFSRLKDFINEVHQNNVIAEINLFSSQYSDGWDHSAFNPKNNINKTDSIASNLVNTLENGNILKYQERYVRKLVDELNSFGNFYFEIENEPWADQTDTVLIRDEYMEDMDKHDWRTTLQVVSKRSEAWQKQVAIWIKDEESHLANKHLISQNISNFYYPVVDPDPNVSIFNFHYAKPEAVWGNYYLNRVIGFNETGFAGSKNYAIYRRQAWRFLMAGGGLFNHLDYSFSVGNETGDDTSFIAPGGGGATLRKQLGILRNIFNQINFIELKPDLSVVTGAPGANTEALSNGHSEWVIYYEPLTKVSQDLLLNLPKGSYKTEWLDALTGKKLEQKIVKNQKLKTPSGIDDKVLLINGSPTIK